MSRQYADPIAVHCCEPALCEPAGSAGSVREAAEPQRFTWRRHRYRVLAVLLRWVEVGSWWRTASTVDEEYEMWRVEAQRSPGGAVGHFDLCRHRSSDHWFLVRAFD